MEQKYIIYFTPHSFDLAPPFSFQPGYATDRSEDSWWEICSDRKKKKEREKKKRKERNI